MNPDTVVILLLAAFFVVLVCMSVYLDDVHKRLRAMGLWTFSQKDLEHLQASLAKVAEMVEKAEKAEITEFHGVGLRGGLTGRIDRNGILERSPYPGEWRTTITIPDPFAEPGDTMEPAHPKYPKGKDVARSRKENPMADFSGTYTTAKATPFKIIRPGTSEFLSSKTNGSGYATVEEAQTACDRVCQQHPGEEFWVVGPILKLRTSIPVTVTDIREETNDRRTRDPHA